jgi:3-oxoadipate enol-lactonase
VSDSPLRTFRAADGCEIAYTLRSSGAATAVPRIVFIHSLGADGNMWRGVVSRLGGDAEMLTYDCRGHGQSGRATDAFTLRQFADDLAQLLDAVNWPAAVVAGCSMGGCVAQAFAGHYRARVSALALIDTTSWYGSEAPGQWRERAAAARAKGLAGMVDFQLTRWFSDRFRAEHPEVMRAAADTLLANDLEGYAAACLMLGDTDTRSFLPEIKVPTAVIVGEDDYATPVVMSRQLHEAIRGSTFATIPTARHLTPIECPDEIAAELRRLLKRVTD